MARYGRAEVVIIYGNGTVRKTLCSCQKIDTAALWYAAFWGVVTALSRAIAGFYWDFPWDSLHQVWHTSAYRLIHGLLPLALLVYIKPISIYLKRRKSALSVSNPTA